MVLVDQEGHSLFTIISHTDCKKLLTSFFLRLLTESGVSSSGDAAVPAARFLTLITTNRSKGVARDVDSGVMLTLVWFVRYTDLLVVAARLVLVANSI
jgi:hypothetical protein